MSKSNYKKRADGRYLAQIQIGYQDNGKPKIKNLYGRTIAELDKKVVEYKANLNKGIVVDDKGFSLGRWATIWLETYKKNLEHNTYTAYKNCVDTHILKSDIANIQLSKIKKHHLQDFLNKKLEDGLTRTVEQLKMTLRQIFKQAVDNEYIYRNVADNLKIPQIKTREKHPLDELEQKAIETADFTPRERLFVYCGLYAGLRRGETLALSIHDIDMKKRLVNVNKTIIFKSNAGEIKSTPKTNAGNRIIPMPDKLYHAFKDRLAWNTNIQLFTTRDGNIMTRTAYRRMWESIENKITTAMTDDRLSIVSNITSHVLRHTYATNLYYAGIDVKTAQMLLGHSDIRMTLEIYTHLQIDNKDISDKLNMYLSETPHLNSVKIQSNTK